MAETRQAANGDRRAEPRVVVALRPVGSSLTVGLAGLAVASVLGAGAALGWVPPDELRQVGLLVLVTVVPLQAIACLFALLARDGATAGGMAIMAATWAAYGASHLMSTPGAHQHPVGLATVAGGALVVLSASTTARAKPLAGLAMALGGAHFVLIGMYELGAAETWQDIGGGVSCAAAAVAAFAAWAFEVEDMTDGETAPTMRRDRGRVAVKEPLEAQLDGVANEPAVRRTL